MDKQKFFRGQRVKIADEMPKSMTHFEKSVEAIIQYSYSDVYGKNDNNNYSLLLIIPKLRTSAWYPAELLTLINTDRYEGECIIQKYKEKYYEELVEEAKTLRNE